MSKAVVYTGWKGEWKQEDTGVTDVTIADGVTEIKEYAFYFRKGLTNFSFLEGSAVTTVGESACRGSGIVTLLGMEDVRKIGSYAFASCYSLRTIEGLGCEEMGVHCFAYCTLLQSMKGWPASMTVIPVYCFYGCTGMTTVACNLSHVTSIGVSPLGYHAFSNCTSLLPPSLSARGADPAAVLAFLKRKSKDERAAARRAFLCSLKHAQSNFYDRTGDPCGASRRITMEFAGLFPA
ncbi:hypothetical protein TeGR_g8602 [Tetraparma gracilis]|uniref:Leucine-rich repeat domain-containing protein n=1 Tax=Tetraparma gracilis TaxID=2962635 RepID=A0ABQ6M8M4_9STRA|nr:hypothetical protein TeGR_g8602 [Tetraparma gracilis]